MNQFLKIIFFIHFLTVTIFAHPHTFIEVKPRVEINNKTIDKLHIKWTLDEMTSMMLIMELDSNGDGKFDKNENQLIYKEYFSALQKYNFYMHITSNKNKIDIEPKNFQASIKNNKLIYDFDIIHHLNIKNLKIDFYDVDLYVGMILEEGNIEIKGVLTSKLQETINLIFGVY